MDRRACEIDKVLVTDFVTPAWFGYENSAGPMDFKSDAKTAFKVLPGGYAQYFDAKKGWEQRNGEAANLVQQHVIHPALGSRRERRARENRTETWRPSDPVAERNRLRVRLREG
ncbi:MAG TPA: hypothetical protein VH062_34220 [Polyangiaceae bacterium]|jgi:hypothetical protein|nr:hypothetical protein [Polyangiaceae bacterium]